MLHKIKTLKEIIEPIAINNHGWSFEEYLDFVSEEERFEIFYKYVLKIANNKYIKNKTKINYGFHDLEYIYKIYKDGYYLDLTIDQKSKIDLISDNIIEDYLKESKPFNQYRTNIDTPCVFINLLETRGLTYQGYNINQHGRHPDEILEYKEESNVFSNFLKLNKLDKKYVITNENYTEYIKILKDNGFLFIEPRLISVDSLGKDERNFYYKVAKEFFKPIITVPQILNEFNDQDAINWINAGSVDLFYLIEQQIKIKLVINHRQKWNDARWVILDYVDNNRYNIHNFISNLNLMNNQELKNNIDSITSFVDEHVNLFNLNTKT